LLRARLLVVFPWPCQVFVLAVSLSFKDKNEKEKWIAAWQPMVEQVGVGPFMWAHEGGQAGTQRAALRHAGSAAA
jgi:hypothetical protein